LPLFLHHGHDDLIQTASNTSHGFEPAPHNWNGPFAKSTSRQFFG
jgi:hypothetical protein